MSPCNRHLDPKSSFATSAKGYKFKNTFTESNLRLVIYFPLNILPIFQSDKEIESLIFCFCYIECDCGEKDKVANKSQKCNRKYFLCYLYVENLLPGKTGLLAGIKREIQGNYENT